jgi:NADH-quinone oxidoreductase subunit H
MAFWSDPITFISQWLQQLLVNAGMAPDLSSQLVALLGALVLPVFSLLWVIFLIWYERKLIGRIQDRFGPNRVGPFGLIQPFADMIKIFTKEYVTPTNADKVPFNMAPILMVASTMFMWAVIPFTINTVGADLNVGVLYLVAVGAVGELGIILAGYSSNNKYSLLAGFRVVAQLVSYEVPMVLALLVPVLLSHSMRLNDIVKAQPIWFIFIALVPAIIFFITSIAEVGRSPFDLIEADSELVAGFNIEYSGLKFGMFYVGDFMHAFTSAMVYAVIFLGGWQGPGAEQFPILGFFYFGIKTVVVHFITILIRGTLPRFRIDQMMNLNWKILTPIALVMVMIVAVLEKILTGAAEGTRAIAHFAANLLVLSVVVLVFGKPIEARRQKLDQAAEINKSMAERILSGAGETK